MISEEGELLRDIRELLIDIRNLIEQFMSEPDTDSVVVEESNALNRARES